MPGATDNRGNQITRRAFSGESFERSQRMTALRRVVNKAMSTAYRMTEEVGEYGSGTPSPLHMVCELVRELERFDREEGCEISTAQEMAEYPLAFLKELRSGVAPDTDAISKLNFLLKSVSDANYLLRGRDLKELSLGELSAFGQKLQNAVTAAGELERMTIELTARADGEYPGAPVTGDRAGG